MGECDGQRAVVFNRAESRATSTPEVEAAMLGASYTLETKFSADLAQKLNDACMPDRIEAELAGRLAAVKNNGDAYSNAVFDALARTNPQAATALRNATIEPDGHIVFK